MAASAEFRYGDAASLARVALVFVSMLALGCGGASDANQIFDASTNGADAQSEDAPATRDVAWQDATTTNTADDAAIEGGPLYDRAPAGDDAGEADATAEFDGGDAEAGPVCSVTCSTSHIGPTCSGAICAGACDPGYSDCNGDKGTDGCEIHTAADPINCGTCGAICPVPANATAVCSAGSCGGACTPGFADCNASMSDGCETATGTDPANCGSCGQGCSSNNVTQACMAGACAGTCAPGFADCNGNKRSDGCEKSVAADVGNCGGCGVVCHGFVGRGCTNGVCNATCDDGIQNQGEADVDCGGPCAPCDVGRKCAAAGDCRSQVCQNSQCVAVRCANRVGLPGPPIFATGSFPGSVAAADLNGDGKVDLAIGNAEGNTLSVFLGQGNGQFGGRTDYTTGSRPSAVAIADVDGDGKPDVVVPNLNSATVSVFINKGNGTFDAKVDYATTTSPSSAAIADLNADGKPDIVVAGTALGILFNAGGGTFGASTSVSPGATVVAAGDMDGDGKPDLVTADSDGVRVFINGGGTFATAPAAYYGVVYSSAIVLSDLNADGKLDVAVSDSGASEVSVFLNNGDGTLGPKKDYPCGGGASGLVVIDLDADGKPDIAASDGSNDVALLSNAGGGVFGTARHALVGDGPAAIASGDFNGDGAPDLVVMNGQNDTASVLLNRAGVFDSRVDYSTGTEPASIAIGDVTGDGLFDLVTVNSTTFNDSSNTVSILRNTGGHAFALSATLATGNEPTSLALSDMNGDGALDIAVANQSDGTVSVFLSKGAGAFAPRVDYPAGSGASSLVAADLSGDGVPDLAVSNSAGVTLLLNNGAGKFPTSLAVNTGEISGLALPQALAVGDLNGDGRPDLARAQIDGQLNGDVPGVAYLTNQGNDSFSLSFATSSARPTFVVIADSNGHGGNEVLVGYQNATVSAGSATYATNGNPESATLADIDGDGVPDLVVASDGPILSVFLATRPGAYGGRMDYVTTGSMAVAAADLDGIGRRDVVAGGGWAGVSVIPSECLP